MNLKPAASKADHLSVWLSVFAVGLGIMAGMVTLSVGSPLWIIIALIGLSFATLTLFRIHYGLVLLVFLTYINFYSVASDHGIPSTARVIVGLLLIAIVFRATVWGEKPEGWIRTALLLSTYAILGLISFSYAADLNAALTVWMEYLEAALLAIVICLLLQSGNNLRQVTWALLAAGIFMGTIAVYQYATNTLASDYWGFAKAEIHLLASGVKGYRIAGPVGDANFFAQILIVVIPLALNRMMNEKKRWMKMAALFALAVCLVAIVFTFSRGAFLALAVTGMFLIISLKPKKRYLALAFVLVVVSIPFLPDAYKQRINTMVDLIPGVGRGVQTDVAFRGRASEAKVALMMFADHPILGVGIGNYPIHYQEYSRLVNMDPRLTNRSAHNLYLQIAAETGIIGLFVFFFILYRLFVGLREARKQFHAAENEDAANLTGAYTIAMLGYFVAAIFLHSAYPKFLWLLVGIALALPQAARNELFVKQVRDVQRIIPYRFWEEEYAR
jgi:O-antigen ligase